MTTPPRSPPRWWSAFREWRVRRVDPLWRSAAKRLLGGSLRLVPAEQNRVFALTVLVGGACGLAATAFHLGIKLAERLLIERALAAPGGWSVWWTIVTPVLGALLAGVILTRFLPQARGSGIPQVKLVYAARSGRLRVRDAIGKFFVSVLQIGSGSSLGREGPTVFICAGLASGLGRLFALSPRNLRRMIPVGAAAGIAAAFNAPIAAVTFTIEELLGDLDQTVLSGVVVAAAFAAVIERSILGEQPVFAGAGDYALRHSSSLLVYAVLGVAAAGASLLFTRSLLAVRAAFAEEKRLPRWLQPAVGGLLTGVVAVLVYQTLRTTGVTGGGYATLSEALSGKLALHVLLVLCAAKLVATVASYSSGGSGGIFAPVLFIGAMLGGTFGFVDRAVLGNVDADLGAFALVGMGAVFAGVIRAPITSVLIIFEMTRGYGLVLPLMVANSIAWALSRKWQPLPIYEALLEQDGVLLPHRSTAVAALSALRVGQAMTSKNLDTLRANQSVKEAVEALTTQRYSTRPVLDEAGAFVGLATEAGLRRRLAEGAGAETVRQQVRPGEALSPDQPLVEAVVRMNLLEVRQMAVVDTDDPRRLVGMLTMSDIMRAHARAAIDDAAEQRVAEPTVTAAQEGPFR